MMFLVEAANTVKRYSAFPKTITSNPKSHFVFGVLPIAHMCYLKGQFFFVRCHTLVRWNVVFVGASQRDRNG